MIQPPWTLPARLASWMPMRCVRTETVSAATSPRRSSCGAAPRVALPREPPVRLALPAVLALAAVEDGCGGLAVDVVHAHAGGVRELLERGEEVAGELLEVVQRVEVADQPEVQRAVVGDDRD